MKTRRLVVLLAVTAVLCLAFLLPGCMRFDGAVDFRADVLTGKKPLPVQFALLVQGCVDTCLWSFGDGTFSRDRNPVHIYEQAGSYTVILTVTPCRGDPVSVRKDDYVTVTSGFGSLPTRMWCYRGDSETHRIWRSELVPPFEGQNSGGNEVLNHTIGVPHDFALLTTMLFWTDQDAETIFAADVAPGQPDNVIMVVGCGDAPVGLAIDPESPKLYWTENDPDDDWRIMRADIDSGVTEEFMPWSARIRDVAFDPVERDLYFSSYYSSSLPRPQAVAQGTDHYVIVRQGVDEGSSETVVSESQEITEIAVHRDGRKLYWYSSGAEKIKRANLDGTDSETIISNVPGVGDLAVDEQDWRIVWVSYVDGIAKLMSAALDGSDVRWRLMNTQTAYYTAIAIGPRPAWISADLSD